MKNDEGELCEDKGGWGGEAKFQKMNVIFHSSFDFYSIEIELICGAYYKKSVAGFQKLTSLC